MLSKVYNPDFFNVDSIESAKRLSLELSEYETWDEQTEWVIDLLKASKTVSEESTFIDWGVGVGRISKAIIDTFNCKVVGLDISNTMLEHSVQYVNNENYSTLTFDKFKAENIQGRFTHAIATWTLQHSPTSQYDISFLTRSLTNNGKLLVVDSFNKKIPKLINADPKGAEWYDDGIKNRIELERWYVPLMLGGLPTKIHTAQKASQSWWALLIKKDTSKPI